MKDDVADFAATMSEWVLERWDAEVKHRPAVNVYRGVLDRTWRQVYSKLTGEELPRPVTPPKDNG